VLDRGRSFGGVRSRLPVARVGGLEQADVVTGERHAPARKAGVYLFLGNVDGA